MEGKNLNLEYFRNGKIIPHAQNMEKWAYLSKYARSYYINQTENDVIFASYIFDMNRMNIEGWHWWAGTFRNTMNGNYWQNFYGTSLPDSSGIHKVSTLFYSLRSDVVRQ